MKTHRTTVAGLALVASLAFLAGCNSDTNKPGAGPSAAPTTLTVKPAEELGVAAMKLASTTHKFGVDAGGTDLTGLVDPAVKSVKIAMASSGDGAEITADVVVIGTDYYIKVGGLQLPGFDATKWYHLDGAKVKSLATFGISSLTDPTGLLVIASGVKDVQKTGPGTYKGTFDLSKPAAGINDATLKALAEKARNIPFEATVGTNGQLTGVKFAVPSHGTEKEMPINITISDHGQKVDIAKPPAAQVVEAPELVYQLLNAPS